MATKLLNSVTRELVGTKVEFGKHLKRPITLTLEPGDMLSFRIKGTRQVFELPISQAFRLAQLVDETIRYQRAMEDYKEKCKAGYKRLRKPKRTAIPYSKIYFDATKNQSNGS